MKANICILLTLLIIIILILYFYINQYSNQVNIKENFDGDKFDGFYGSVGFCISDNAKITPWREANRTNTSDCTDQCLKDKNCQAVHFASDLKDNYCLFFKKNNVSDSTYYGNHKNGYDIDNNAIITKGDNNKNLICYIKDDAEANKLNAKLTKYVVLTHPFKKINLSKVRLYDNNNKQLSYENREITISTNAEFDENADSITPEIANLKKQLNDYQRRNIYIYNVFNNIFLKIYQDKINQLKGRFNNKPENLITAAWNWNEIVHTAQTRNRQISPSFNNFGNSVVLLITLAKPTNLSSITILNRQDCCQNITDGIRVITYNENQEQLFNREINTQNTPAAFFQSYTNDINLSLKLELPKITETEIVINNNSGADWDNQGCWFDLNNSDGNNNERAINGTLLFFSGSSDEKKNKCFDFANKKGANVAGMQNGNQCWYENNNYNSYKQYGKVPDSLGCSAMGGALINNVWTKKNRVEIPDFDISQPIEIKRIVIERQGWKSGDVLSQFINISKIYLYDENKNKIVSGLTANGNLAFTTGDQQPSNLVNYTNNGDTNFALNYHTNTTTSIISDSKPYINFDVKLASPQKLTQIDIKNRTDCCQDRILGLVLKAYNVRGIEIFRYYFNEVKNYYQIPVNIDLPQNTTISLPFSKLTKYVKLEKINYNPYVPDTQLINISKIKLYNETGAQIKSGLTADLNPIYADSLGTYGPNVLIDYDGDPNNDKIAHTFIPNGDTMNQNQRLNSNTPQPFMKVELNTPSRLSKIEIINRKEPALQWYRMIGVRLSGFDENNNVLYTYNFTRALPNYTIMFNIETEYNKNNNNLNLFNQVGSGYGISNVVKTIKLEKQTSSPIAISKIYIYDDKNQLIKGILTPTISPVSGNSKFSASNLVKYDDDLQNITSIGKSNPPPPGSFANIQILIDPPKPVSKVILLNYTENNNLNDLIKNTKLSLLGDSGNELFKQDITQVLEKYEINTQFITQKQSD